MKTTITQDAAGGVIIRSVDETAPADAPIINVIMMTAEQAKKHMRDAQFADALPADIAGKLSED